MKLYQGFGRETSETLAVEVGSLLRGRGRGFATLVGLLRGEGHRHTGLANLKAREAAHGDVLAQLADFGRYQLADADGLIFDERLLEQADFLVELFHLTGDHLLGDVLWLAAGHGDQRARLAGRA